MKISILSYKFVAVYTLLVVLLCIINVFCDIEKFIVFFIFFNWFLFGINLVITDYRYTKNCRRINNKLYEKYCNNMLDNTFKPTKKYRIFYHAISDKDSPFYEEGLKMRKAIKVLLVWWAVHFILFFVLAFSFAI